MPRMKSANEFTQNSSEWTKPEFELRGLPQSPTPLDREQCLATKANPRRSKNETPLKPCHGLTKPAKSLFSDSSQLISTLVVEGSPQRSKSTCSDDVTEWGTGQDSRHPLKIPITASEYECSDYASHNVFDARTHAEFANLRTSTEERMKALLALVTTATLLAAGARTTVAQTWPGEAARQRINEALAQNDQPGAIPPPAPETDYLNVNPTAPAAVFAPSTGDDSCTRFAGCCDGMDPRGYKFSWAPDKWAKVGAAVRASFNSQTYAAPGLGNHFAVDNARLLTSGQVTKYVGFELNSDVALGQGFGPSSLQSPSPFNLLDAIVKVETGDAFNVWAGQFLPPSDRSTIDGPFFINGWDFPFVSAYPGVFEGRQIGAAYWGQYSGGQIKWSVGAFNGTGGSLQSPYTNPPNTPPNPNNNIQFDARVTFNFLDAEPGYYHQSTYYGQKDILALGFAIQTQHNALGTSATPANFTGLNMDFLYETSFENEGVITVEGALYKYNNQDLVTSSQQGQSGFIYLGYMFPKTISVGPVCGRVRPFTRYQQYNRDYLAPSAGLFSQGLDVGVEYVMNGPNARLTAVWSERDVVAGSRLNIFTIGAQMVF
ncbi:MAG: hypothetical protein JWP89_2286 [Schlesneria sp.]|nr:hypothetical protein [Schlesneria sp.]